MKSLLRSALIWTLSVLLGTQQAVFAATKSVNQDIKTFLEQSGITQRSMSLREFYGKNMAYLPVEARAQVESFLQDFPDYQLPKVDVNKISGPNGEEVYQLQAIQKGSSVSMTLNSTDSVFLKVNGKNISPSEMLDLRVAMKEAGVPANVVDQTIPARRPAGLGSMSADRFAKLSKVQRKQYIKQTVQLLESIEAAQNSGLGAKTSANPESKIEFFAQVFSGSPATASDQDKSCIAAGWDAVVKHNTGRPGGPGFTCGSDGSGGVAPAYRGSCAVNQYQCNPVVFGDKAPCVSASRETTKDCSETVQKRTVQGNDGLDIPDTAKARQEFFDLKGKALEQAKKLQGICSSTTYEKSGLTTDQKYTCQNLNARLAEIDSWNCNDKNYATHANLEKICKTTPDPGTPVTPGQPPTPGQPGNPPTNPPGSPADTRIWCDRLPRDMSTEVGSQVTCVKGTVMNASCLFLNDKKEEQAKDASQCVCDNGGKIVGKMACDGGSQSSPGTGGSDHESTKKKSKWGKWLLMGGLVIGGAFLFYWMYKKAMKKSFQNLDPDTINPPVTVPPLPTTLPPPIPVAPKGVK